MPFRRPQPPLSEIQRWHRHSARLALYGSLLIVAATAVGLAWTASFAFSRAAVDLDRSQDWFAVDWASLPEVQLFQHYLQVDTNAVDGNEAAGAEFLAQQLEAAGIPYHLERLGARRANLWAILEGDDPSAIVLHHHMDVEPIYRPEAWRVPPFGGTIEPPWIYGRGAFDMKSLAIAQLWAFLELKRSGLHLSRSVIFLATGSEERGSDFGTRWILRNHPELVQRFGVVLTEGGVVEAVDRDHAKYWGIEVGQKRFVDLEVCSQSRERLEELRDLANRNPRPVTGLTLLPEVAAFLPAYATTRHDTELQALLADPQQVLSDVAAFEKLPEYVRAMFRNELVVFPVEEDGGGGYRMIVKLHLLPDADAEAARRQLLPDWMLWGFDTAWIDRPSAHHGSPADHPVVREMEALVAERYPEFKVGPYFLPWTATDSRFFRLAGIPSYGFSPFLILTPDTLTGANPNERVALPGFVSGVQLYTELLQRLAAHPAGGS